MIRPTRFIVCNNHTEWKTDWKELSDHLNVLSMSGTEFYNVDKFPLHLQTVVSHASEISLYRPDTCKTTATLILILILHVIVILL